MTAHKAIVKRVRQRGLTATLALAATATTLAACGNGGDQPRQRASSSAAPSAPASNSLGTRSSERATTNEKGQETAVDIRITIDAEQFEASLTDSAASRDLQAQLPVTLEMRDHGGVEKTGRLPSPLSLEGQPEGADPDVGDVGYYAPGNDLVLYYGDQSYYPGIVILGRLSAGAADRIADLEGSVTAQVDTIGN